MPAAPSAGAPARRLWEELRARPELIWLAAIVAIAALVRFSTLGVQSFDSGETITAARILQPSYAATFHAYSTIERSGPLYYTLAWGWAHLFGTGEVALRSLSAIFGTATIVFVFLTARELIASRAALIAAGLAALSPDLLWYSQEARSYALFIMLTAAALYFFVRALRRPSRRALVGWAVASALALCTHYFSAFSIAPEALWLLWVNRHRPRGVLAAVGSVGAVGLALLPLAIHQEGSGRANAFTAIPVLERVASSLVKFVAGEGPATAGLWTTIPIAFRVVGVIALALAAFAVALVLSRGTRGERSAAMTVGGVGAVAFAVPVALALGGIDYIEPRNLLGSLVPFLIVVAAGIEVAVRIARKRCASMGTRLAPAVVPAALFAAVIVATSLTPSLQRYNWRALGRLVAATPRAGVIFSDPAAAVKPLHYFLGRPLAPLNDARYPCGVRSRTIVTVSRHPPRANHVYGFGLVQSRQTSQGWLVDTYRAPSPRPLDGVGLQALRILSSNAVPRVDAARPITARTAERESLLARSFGWGRAPSDASWLLGGGPGRAATSVDPPGWPPRSCFPGRPQRSPITASAARPRSRTDLALGRAGAQPRALAAGAVRARARRPRRGFNSSSSSASQSTRHQTSGI